MLQGFADIRVELEQRFVDMQAQMRTDMERGLTGLRSEMQSGFADVNRRFGDLQHGVSDLQHNVSNLQHGVSDLGRGFAELHQGLAVMGRRLDAIDDRVRGNGVLLEALRGEIRQIAEAHAMLDQRVEHFRRENEAAHQEILTLLRSSYHELDRRVTRLEARLDEGGRGV